MDSSPREFFEKLLQTPRPSGFEQPVQAVVRQYLEPYADEIRTDRHGNVIASHHADAPLRLMLDGHCDQIGMLVMHIDDSGYIYAQAIGGWDPQQLIGQRMTIWTAQGPVDAIIARKPIHLLSDQEVKQTLKVHELWLDIGASDRAAAAELVRIGDPVTLELGMRRMLGDRANAPGMDNASGLWVVVEAFRRACIDERPVPCALFVASTVQEEIGLRGARTSAFSIDPHVAIAVDVTHATDCPTIEQRQYGDLKLGGGPVIFRGPNMNPVVSETLIAVAEDANIPYQLAAIGRATPNDANSIQISRAGVATGLVSVPNRYMHSAVETISLNDIDHCANLLAEFILCLCGEEDFVPSQANGGH